MKNFKWDVIDETTNEKMKWEVKQDNENVIVYVNDKKTDTIYDNNVENVYFDLNK